MTTMCGARGPVARAVRGPGMHRLGKTLGVLAFATATAGNASGLIVYSNDFQSAAGSEWSSAAIESTPLPNDGSRRFLGRFTNDTVSLSLSGLPGHGKVTLEFDLYVIQSWDGNGSPGPDIWRVGAHGGPLLIRATFSNCPDQTQSYPDSFDSVPSGSTNPPKTGATEIGTLGYPGLCSGSGEDSVYHLTLTFPHPSTSLRVDFSAENLQSASDESWGLDNVSVSVAPCETTLDCDDHNPCTADSCAIDGICVNTPDPLCWNLAGTNILRVSVSGSVRGHNVRCWLRCRQSTGATLFLYPDGRYGIPAPGPGLVCAFPDGEHGITRTGRHDRLRLEPDDIHDIEANFSACLAAKVRLRRYDTRMRFAEDGDHLIGKTRVRAGFRAPTGYGVKLPVLVRMKAAFAGARTGTLVEPPPLKPKAARLRECPPSLGVKCVVD